MSTFGLGIWGIRSRCLSLFKISSSVLQIHDLGADKGWSSKIFHGYRLPVSCLSYLVPVEYRGWDCVLFFWKYDGRRKQDNGCGFWITASVSVILIVTSAPPLQINLGPGHCFYHRGTLACSWDVWGRGCSTAQMKESQNTDSVQCRAGHTAFLDSVSPTAKQKQWGLLKLLPKLPNEYFALETGRPHKYTELLSVF